MGRTVRFGVVAALSVAAAIVVPASSAHAACVMPITGPNTGVCAESEGVAPVPGGFTSASTIWVYVNGTRIALCIGRTTVTTAPVVAVFNPPYLC